MHCSGAKIYVNKPICYAPFDEREVNDIKHAFIAKPFIYLCAGVGNAQFTESLQMAS